MRVNIVLTLIFTLLGLFSWVLFSGFWFVLSALFMILFLTITVGYSDKAILFFLGARGLRSSDEKAYFQAASQEAYKLNVPTPHLYFYNGSLERAFVLQNFKTISLVLDKSLLDGCTSDELSAICFELLLQVKKGLATKRTKAMFLLGINSWLVHSISGLFLKLIPVREVHHAANWVINFFLQPWLLFLFKLMVGQNYFLKLQSFLDQFPQEKDDFRRLGLRIREPSQIYSLPSRKLIELSSISRGRHFQNILTLEFLPHEWDFLFRQPGSDQC
jgi:hypothetical protein